MNASRTEKLLFIAPAIAYLLVFSIFPLIYSVGISLTDLNVVRKGTGNFVGLSNYVHLFSSGSLFVRAVTNTFIIMFFALLIEIVLGFIIARLFYLVRSVRFVTILRTMYIIPIMITPLIFGLVWSYVLNPLLGVGNVMLKAAGLHALPWLGSPKTALATIVMIDVWQWTPFLMMLIFSGFMTIPHELFEAAEVDGARLVKKITHIELPFLKQVIGLALILRSMDVFRMFDLIYATTQGGPGGATEVISMFAYRQSFNYYNTSIGSTASIIALIIITIISNFFNKITKETRG